MAYQNIIRLFCRMGFIILILGFGLGCSRNDQPEPPKKSPKVTQSIKTSSSKADKTVKESPEPVKAEPVQKQEEKLKTDIEKSESKTIQPGKITSKSAVDSGKQENAPGDEPLAKLYHVKPGDTLAIIAGRNDVFGDPIKWPTLYRLNYDQLKHLSGSDNLPRHELPQGMTLNIITENEQKRILEERKNQFWVVNVLSSPIEKEIIQETDRLIQKGYPVYITKFYIEGKAWQRLRIGFFNSKTDADKFGREIMSKLKLPAFWSAKIGDREFGKYAGY